MSVRFPFSRKGSHYIPESGDAIELLFKDDGHPSWEDCPSHHVPSYSPPRLFPPAAHFRHEMCRALPLHEKADFVHKKESKMTTNHRSGRTLAGGARAFPFKDRCLAQRGVFQVFTI
jgi:hypothetical protein